MSEPRFKLLKASFELKGADGFNQSFTIEGTKVPDEPREIGAYVSELIQKPLTGYGSAEAKAAASQLADMKKANTKLEQQLEDAKAELAALKKAK